MSLGADLARGLDPVALATRIGMDCDEWQSEVLRSTSGRVLLNIHRQGGKSTIAAIAAVHVALYEPGSLILLVSPALRQSQELFRKALTTYRTLGRPVPAEQESALSLTLENGSRIVSLPGQESTVRSYSAVRLLIVDEAARVPDELYYSTRPMLAVSGGRIIAMSTPFGKRGWFYESWTGQEAWQRYEVQATESPRISSDFLEEERRTLGEWWYAQEYLCEFKDTSDQLFSTDFVMGALTPEVEPLFGGAHG